MTDASEPDIKILLRKNIPKPKIQKVYTNAPQRDAEEYNMNHSNRGIALIFNHMKFSLSQCSDRYGTNKDRDDISGILRDLSFEVRIHNDLRASEIKVILESASNMDHSDSDCLVVIVMSHGDDQILYARDREYSTNLLWKYFAADVCPTLAGKPKLFFIQACRGDGLDHGAYVSSVETDAIPLNKIYSIPAMADILIMYSTVDGYYAWRDPINGSYFIQSLVDQLRNHSDKRDLLSILTFVNRQVAIEFTSNEPSNALFSGCKQMCSIVSMLTRLVFFNQME